MHLSPKIRNKLLFFGYYQIIGGIIGIGLISWLLFNLSSFKSLLLVIIIPAFLLFFFSMYCGNLLLRHRANGIKLSMLNQYLQLISFSISGYAYQYFSGLYISMGFDFTESLSFSFGLGVSSYKLNIDTDDPSIFIDFNFIALIVILMLDKLNKQIRDEQKMNLFDESELPG